MGGEPREAVTVDSLRSLEVFAALPRPVVEQLLRVSHVRSLSMGQPLSSIPRVARSECYCFVLSGLMSIVLRHKTTSRSPSNGAQDSRVEFIGYFEPGDCFSDGFLDLSFQDDDPALDCIARAPSVLLQTSRQRLLDLMAGQAAWAAELARKMASARHHFERQREPTRRVVQDFFLRYRYEASSTARIIQLNRCLDCNKCSDACAKRHGVARMQRGGPRLGQLIFPVVCRSCIGRPCESACSLGALSFDEEVGEIRISNRCIGCGACAKTCPNQAIFMVQVPYTVADFAEPIPSNNADGQTNVPNLYVAGDVAGAGLIKLSVNDAVRCVDKMSPRPAAYATEKLVDVVIVGAGPAGLAAALRCRERNLQCVVLEKDRFLSSIQDYPKNKHVMAEPSSVPMNSSLWFEDCSKEELLERWHRTVVAQGLDVWEGVEVQRIERGQDGLFTVANATGTILSRHVLVCIGKRGTPRKLGVPGECEERVRYVVSDPDAFARQRILVVGGGDSALEAALALADVPGTHVTLSYRQAAFTRAKPLNRERLERYQAQQKIFVVLRSTVKALEYEKVRLKVDDGERVISNDIVFALLGADSPTPFLQQAGIKVLEPGSQDMVTYAASRGNKLRAAKCDHCAGFADRACLRACPTGALLEMAPQEVFLSESVKGWAHGGDFSETSFIDGVGDRPVGRRRKIGTYLLKGLALAALFDIGLECFLRSTVPERSFQAIILRLLGQAPEVSFSSGKGFGHWLGYIGTGLMLSTVFYPLRTRLGVLKNFGASSAWLSVHLWTGFSGAMLVTFHSALKLDRWVGIACACAWIVVLSGAIGRYLKSIVESRIGLADFEKHVLLDAGNVVRRLRRDSMAIRILMSNEEWDSPVPRKLFLFVLWEELRDRLVLSWLWCFGLRSILEGKGRRRALRFLSAWASNRRRRNYLENAKAIFWLWRWIHVLSTLVMLVLAGIHITYALMYKAW